MIAQTRDIKVMTYNLMYYKDLSAPCTQSLSFAQKDAAFKTVFKAVNPDLMCVNELVGFSDNSGAQSILTNVINTDGETNFTTAAYTNNGFSSITNMLFYDSTLFALDKQDYITHALNNQALVRVIDFYRLYFKDPALKLGADTVFFTVVSCHLKAGNSGPDRNEREDAIQAVMDHLTNDVADENVILMGDLNVYGSGEGAYQELVNYSVASERFADPGVAGSWNNNNTFAILHTQSTHSSSSGCYSGGGLDDRFDMVLHSQAINNGTAGMTYKLNSMKAVGNDGAHFNQSINAGTNSAVGSTVANALYDFSDHLPVISEFSIALSDISIAENHLSELEISNPVARYLSINGINRDLRTIQLYDITGIPVLSLGLDHESSYIEWDLGSIKNGIYILELQDTHGNRRVEKILKHAE